MSAPMLETDELTLRVAARTLVRELDFRLHPGEVWCLLGQNGSGKTTLMHTLVGLGRAQGGAVQLAGKELAAWPAADAARQRGFLPHTFHDAFSASVLESVMLGRHPYLSRWQWEGEGDREIALAALALVDLVGFEERDVLTLSGGERQRVALGRAIVRQPKVFLFDEPLSNLDAKLRVQMRAELVRLHRRLKATMVYVTHDQVEAMTMGQRIAILHRGVLQQVGTPAEIYARPANVFVAAFIGAPGMNVIEAGARRADAKEPGTTAERAHGRAEVHSVGFRPEDARVVADGEGDFAGVVALVEPLGPEALVHVKLDAGETAVVRVREGRVPVVEERVGLAVPSAKLHAFGADGRRLGA